jgi:CRP/FNR family transcriptional regulator, nitrogen oxide reductase regulator
MPDYSGGKSHMATLGSHVSGPAWSGCHIISIYEDTAELAAFAVPFIRDGLAWGEHCLYIVDDLRTAEATEMLALGGVDVDREIKRGALTLTRWQEHFGPQAFDARHAFDVFRRELTDAISGGFTGLRVAAEMTWTLKAGVPEDVLVAYESLWDSAAAGSLAPRNAACMYRKDRFSASVLQQLVRNHTETVARDSVIVGLSPMFQNLARADLHALLRSANGRRVPKGGFYYRQGDAAREVVLLTSGRVKLVRANPGGRNVITYVAAPTDLIGWVGALRGTSRAVSAQALEDSRALVWDVATILRTITHSPTIAVNVIHLMAERLAGEMETVQDLATPLAEQRLARVLLRILQRIGRKTAQGAVIELPLSGQDLSEMISATPYTISRILAEWRRQDIVDAHRDRILVLNEPRITVLAGDD